MLSQIVKQKSYQLKAISKLNQSILNNSTSLVDTRNQHIISSQVGIYSSLPKALFAKYLELDLYDSNLQNKKKKKTQSYEQVDGKIVLYFYYFKKRVGEENKLLELNQFQSIQEAITRYGKRKCVLDIISQFRKDKIVINLNFISTEKYKLMRYSGTFLYKILSNEDEPDNQNLVHQDTQFKRQIVDMQRKFDSVFNDKGFTFRFLIFIKFVKYFPNRYVFYGQDVQPIFVFAEQVQQAIDCAKVQYYQQRSRKK
ncbi:hypothetical protein SS50377_20849 [Spironucleus salmonicida]|nr:hypothetical protein SS50377_20849 [Spironucleus salmonicida]